MDVPSLIYFYVAIIRMGSNMLKSGHVIIDGSKCYLLNNIDSLVHYASRGTSDGE